MKDGENLKVVILVQVVHYLKVTLRIKCSPYGPYWPTIRIKEVWP